MSSAHSAPAVPADASGTRRAGRRFAWFYAAWLFGLIAYFLPGPTWNPVSRFDLTRSIVERGTVTIDDIADDTGDKAFARGHWYSDKAPLPALVAVPVYAVLHALDRARGIEPEHHAVGAASHPEMRVEVNDAFRWDLYACSLATSAVAGTAVGVLLFELLRNWTSPLVALFGSLAATLGTPVFPYATSFYGHVPAGACLLGGLLAVVPPAGVAWPSSTRMRWGGAALATAIGCEYITAIPVAVLVAWTLVAGGRDRVGATCRDLAIGAALPLGALGVVHTLSFGAPWRTGYSHIAREEFAAGHARGLLGIEWPRLDVLVGLLVGPRRGLVYVAPITAMLAAWWATSLKEAGWAMRAAALAAASLLLANAGYFMWWGGAAAGPRHLVPVLALLGLGAPAVWDQTAPRRVALALTVISALNMTAIAAVGLEAPERANVLYWVWGKLVSGHLAAIRGSSNLGIEIGLPRGGSLGPWLAWAVVGLRLVWKRAAALDAEPSPPQSQEGLVAANR
jgi:hypothetical protein